jgi:hypothetical protein
LIAGVDYSTRAVDVVLLDEDSDAATWHRFELLGNDAFDRTRDVQRAFNLTSEQWDSVVAVGIENPGGKFGTSAMYRVQGAVLASIPFYKLVQPFPPAAWRKHVGLSGRASKTDVQMFVDDHRIRAMFSNRTQSDIEAWPQDACDAYCIALATRTLLERVPA